MDYNAFNPAILNLFVNNLFFIFNVNLKFLNNF